MSKPTRIVINGVAGRMGRAIARAMLDREDCRLAAGIEGAASPYLNAPVADLLGDPRIGEAKVEADLASTLPDDCVIDFSHVSVAQRVIQTCVEKKTPLVMGTTGLEASHKEALKTASKTIPVVFAPNMSVGVNVLIKLVEKAARTLGDGWDIEIVEAHHNKKADAPSGTALRLGEAAAGGPKNLERRANYHREGMTGPRNADEIGMQTLRGGDTPGEHTVFFFGEGERIELTHRALTRDIFARGAVRAAVWLADQKPGMYDMNDVLGLTER